MESHDSRRQTLETRVEVMAAEMRNISRDVEEIKTALQRWLDNAARERGMILIAVLSGWLGLIASAITALLHR